MSAHNLMIVQGGGPTAVFNASLAGVIDEARRHPRFRRIYGARSGTKGLATGDVAELKHLGAMDLAALAASPGAALGSSRFQPTDDDLERCVACLRHHEIRHVIFMGGNGTMRGAAIVLDFCKRSGYEVQIVGVPKTIDNDIAGTDRSPGFGSAARFVAQSTLDLAMDIRSLVQPVSIFETLGRDVGWLAAASTLAKLDEDAAPHLVCVPEVPFVRDTFLARLDATVARIGWAVVVVSEGTAYADGTPVFEQRISSEKNKANRPLIGGVAQYLSGVVAAELGLRCRSEKAGLIGRSCMALVSAQDRADAELVGREGVHALAEGATGVMVALRPLSENGPRCESVPLAAVAGIRRAIPQAWITENGLAVGQAFREYAEPLVGKLSHYPAPLL